MVRPRAKAGGITTEVCNHTFRGTGISANLENETLEKVRQMRVGHRLCARIPPSHREGVPYLTGIPGPM
jgi:hypothetical protein